MRATIKDVANLAGVTPSIISRYLNNDPTLSIKEETKDKINKAVSELKYKPNSIAQGLRTKKSRMLGIMIPDIGNPTFSDLLKGAQDAAYNNDFFLVICNTEENNEKEDYIVNMLLEKNADGIFLASAYINSNVTKKLDKAKIPYVMVNRTIRSEKGYSVSCDNISGASMVVEHLISLGHKKIAHIAGSLFTDTATGRLQGYRKTLIDNRIDYFPDYIVEAPFSFEGGYIAMKKLLELKDIPTAVFVVSDLPALGALSAIKETNILVPDDISLAGFNNNWVVNQVTPRLTTIETDFYNMGYKGAEMLIQLVNENQPEQAHIVFKPKLIVRESTSPPKQEKAMKTDDI